MTVSKMDKTFSIHAVLTDTGRANKKTHLLAQVDTVRNHTLIYQLSDTLIDEDKDIDSQLHDLFHETPGYKIEILSDLIVKLTDKLGGIDLPGGHIDGRQALQSVYDGHFDEVIDAIGKTLAKKNLLLTVPGLLNALSDTYKTDLPLMEAIKTFISEIPELNDWKIELRKIENKDQIQ
ncbi:MAG: hypothetical protein K5648_02225 [Erysipelotrichaceae bacterium]|nr:hypothetical protein [Erysipelotrichaceae bacterium]